MKTLKIGDKTYELGKKTLVMGVLNVTPDSFFDGGRYFSFEKAVEHGIQMEKEGADIIDIGGESTRPGSAPIPLSTEMTRVIPVIEELVTKINVPISIDTYKRELMESALDAGARMVNDITSLSLDKKLVNIVVEYDVPICLMHMKGSPSTMQLNPMYDDVMDEVKSFLKERAGFAISQGVKKENIIVDPGLGFGKRTGNGVEDNCEIIQRLAELKDLGFPILVGASRKTFIGNICGKNKPLPLSERLEGSLAAAAAAVMNGADIIRAHDVKETRRVVDLVDRIVR